MADLRLLYPDGFNANRFAMPKDHSRQFLNALQAGGLQVESLDQAGEIRRVRTAEDKGSKRTGWYVFHQGADFSAGAFGDWRSGDQHTWSSHAADDLSAEQRVRHQNQMAEFRAIREREQAAEYEAAKKKSKVIWMGLDHPKPDNQYLLRKQIQAFGAKENETGKLVIPVMDSEGEIQSLQFIDQDGTKRFLSGGKMKGGRFIIGKPGKTIYICEGYSTGATIYEAAGDQVICAFNASNLSSVAESIRSKNTNARIIIAADNDQFLPAHIGNVGANKAKEAAAKISASVRLPEFSNLDKQPTDFNDLACLEGIGAVRVQLERSPTSRLNIKRLSEIGFDEKPVDWLIKGFLEARSLSVLFAPPASYKTFMALDWALCMALGKDWNYAKVKKRRSVVYVNG